jgi:hypothetical protein
MADVEPDARLVLDGRPLSVCQLPQATRNVKGKDVMARDTYEWSPGCLFNHLSDVERCTRLDDRLDLRVACACLEDCRWEMFVLIH